MKRFTTYDLGYALQIFAVILLFGYPGCSSSKVQKEINTDKAGLIIKKHTAPQVNMKNIIKAGDSSILLNHWEPEATRYSLFTGVRK